jgi:hypothetical protein
MKIVHDSENGKAFSESEGIGYSQNCHSSWNCNFLTIFTSFFWDNENDPCQDWFCICIQFESRPWESIIVAPHIYCNSCDLWDFACRISAAVSISQFDLHSIADLSLLWINTLQDLLSSDSPRVESEDMLLIRLLQYRSEYSRLLRHVRFEPLCWEGISSLADGFVYFNVVKSLWDEIIGRFKHPPLPARWLDSCIASSFPPLFGEFCGKQFVLLWRGSRDDFGGRDFHGQCDGRANTLTFILDTVHCL